MLERVIRFAAMGVWVLPLTGMACAQPAAIRRLSATPSEPPFELRLGDLLFQDLDGGPLSDAIELVTTGYRGAKFTHVGIVCGTGSGNDSELCSVLEAVSQGVQIVPLHTFLARSRDARHRPKVVVGRLRPEYQHLVTKVLEYGLSLEGKPYDPVFEMDNDAYYCSELIYEMFLHAYGGQPMFTLEPMIFTDPATRVTSSAWAKYFDTLSLPVPEGRPGINPGGISRSPHIDIVHMYGTPTGWNGEKRASE